MAPKRPYTAERLRQAARASADGARANHPIVADLSCEYLWPPLLSVSSVLVRFFFEFATRCEWQRVPRYRGVANEGVDIEAPLRKDSQAAFEWRARGEGF